MIKPFKIKLGNEMVKDDILKGERESEGIERERERKHIKIVSVV